MALMKIGLLVCDHVRPEFLEISGDYDDMFRRLFADREDVEVTAYDAINGELPADPSDADAWLTTGSRYSVNDDEPWIRDLERFRSGCRRRPGSPLWASASAINSSPRRSAARS